MKRIISSMVALFEYLALPYTLEIELVKAIQAHAQKQNQPKGFAA